MFRFAVISALAFAAPAYSATDLFVDMDAYKLRTTVTAAEIFDDRRAGPLTAGVPTSFNGFTITNESPNQAVGVYSSETIQRSGGSAGNGSKQLAWGESSELGVNGSGAGATFRFDFDTAITAFGFHYSDSDQSDAYQVTINGESFTLGMGLEFSGFIGFISDVAFSSVIFSQALTGGTTETFTIDNVLITNAAARQAAPAQSIAQVSAVPVPAALPLALTGVGLLAAIGRRKRRQTAAG